MDDNVLTLDNEYQEDVDLEGEVYAVGERGYSAYEIALQNGYVGTEEEWLESLKGDKGDPGEGVPTGGTAGQILSKASGTDYDTEWVNPPDISNMVTTNGQQNISGLKIFNSYTPQCPNVPLYDNQLTNKKYVDDSINAIEPYTAGNGITIDNKEINVDMPNFTTNEGSSAANVFIIDTHEPGVYYFEYIGTTISLGITGQSAYTFYAKGPVFILTDSNIDTTSSTPKVVGYLIGHRTNSSSNNSEIFYSAISVTGSTGYISMSAMYASASVNPTTASTISGLKTFTTLPESSVVPTTNNQLANKKYVDDNAGQIIQYETMPVASSSNEGQIVQYVGSDETTYTNGYFYQVISDGEEPATYSWSPLEVQPGGEAGVIELEDAEISLGNDTMGNIEPPSHDAGVYILKGTGTKINYNKNSSTYSPILNNGTRLIVILADINSYGQTAYLYGTNTGPQMIFLSFSVPTVVTVPFENLALTNAQNIFTEKQTFTTLPESSVTPTTNNQLVNKKYVDDNGGQTIQYDTMPTASEDTVGQVVQYIGTTDTDYTNGYFYIGATDGEDPATYSWEQLNVQPGSSGTNGTYLPILEFSRAYASFFNSTVNVDDEYRTKVAAMINDYHDKYMPTETNINLGALSFIMRVRTSQTTTNVLFSQYGQQYQGNTTIRFIGMTPIKNPTSSTIWGINILQYEVHGTWTNGVFTCTDTTAGFATANNTYKYFDLGNMLTKNNTESYTPTGNYNPATKKYVDDAIAGAGGSYTAGAGIDITNDIISSTLPIYTVDTATYNSPFVVEGKPLGLYIFKHIPAPYITGYSNGNIQSIQLYNGFILLTNTTIDHTSATYQQIGYVWGSQLDSSHGYVGNYTGTLSVYGTTGKTTVGSSSNAYAVASTGNSTIDGKKTFNTLPESSPTPTTNNQLVNKKYVDDSIASAITDALGGSY